MKNYLAELLKKSEFQMYIRRINDELVELTGYDIADVFEWLKENDRYKLQFPCHDRLFNDCYTLLDYFGDDVELYRNKYLYIPAYIFANSESSYEYFTIWYMLDYLNQDFNYVTDNILNIL